LLFPRACIASTPETLREDKEKKVRRAVTLSEENYCGVFATLRPSMALTTEIVVNDQLLAAEAQATAPADDA
jgi:hypothetical protein